MGLSTCEALVFRFGFGVCVLIRGVALGWNCLGFVYLVGLCVDLLTPFVGVGCK